MRVFTDVGASAKNLDASNNRIVALPAQISNLVNLQRLTLTSNGGGRCARLTSNNQLDPALKALVFQLTTTLKAHPFQAVGLKLTLNPRPHTGRAHQAAAGAVPSEGTKAAGAGPQRPRGQGWRCKLTLA